jgi:hypothetical protein
MGKLPSFESVLEELNDLQKKKGADYGTKQDPLANIRASEKFGIPAWLGSIIRLNDKVNRVASFATKGTLENESLEDSLVDMAVYAIHALRLYRESLEPTGRDFVVAENDVLAKLIEADDGKIITLDVCGVATELGEMIERAAVICELGDEPALGPCISEGHTDLT